MNYETAKREFEEADHILEIANGNVTAQDIDDVVRAMRVDDRNAESFLTTRQEAIAEAVLSHLTGHARRDPEGFIRGFRVAAKAKRDAARRALIGALQHEPDTVAGEPQ